MTPHRTTLADQVRTASHAGRLAAAIVIAAFLLVSSGSPLAGPATADASTSCLSFTDAQFNPAGRDVRHLNGELVRVHNECSVAVRLGGWRIANRHLTHRYTVPSSYRLGAGRTVVIHVGRGRDTRNALYMDRTRSFWANGPGERALLIDRAGRVVDAARQTPKGTKAGAVVPSPTPIPTPAPDGSATPAHPTPSPTAGPTDCSRTIQARVDAAAAGSTVTVPACVYRERVSVTKPLTLVGAPGAEIRGSDVWTAWTASGAGWTSTLAVPVLYNPGSTCTPGTSRCAWPEQVFLDGQPQLQVATTATPAAGQFRLDGSRHVVLGSSPAGRTVEVSVRENWLWIGASDVTVRGFTMRHAATWAQGGGLQVGGYWAGAVNRATITGNVLADAHGRDLSLEGGTGHRVTGNDVSGAGCLGIGGSGGTDWVISANRVHGNATEDFDVGMESGGVKLLHTDGLVMADNEVDHNSRGIWTDTDVRNATFSGNRLHDNANNGLFLESGHYLTVVGNTAWENGWGTGGAAWAWGGGITLSSSDHADVHDNTVAWNADGITVISQSRTDDAAHVEINIHANTIAMAPRTGDTSAFASGWVMDWSGVLFAPASNNRGTANRYWYGSAEGGTTRYAWNGNKSTLADFAATPAGTGASYLTSGALAGALAAAGVPAGPVAR